MNGHGRRWTPTLVTLLPAIVLGALFAVTLPNDPAPGVTLSHSPYTDESWNVLNARNFVLLGTWATDEWAMHLLNLPFSLLAAAVFEVFGVGIVQARAMAATATVLAVALVGLGLRPRLGVLPALVGSAALAASPLVIYYGRLAYLESVVVLFLVGGALLSLQATGPRAGVTGLLAGALLAAAIGVKPLAAIPVAGILAGVLVTGGLRGPASAPVRRWVAGAVVAVIVAGAGWLLLVALPNWEALRADLRIPPRYWPHSIAQLLRLPVAWIGRSDGVIPVTLPLLAVGLTAAALAVRHRSRLTLELRILGMAAFAWFVAGWGAFLFVLYRPNRYFVPILPALAILVAIGWAAATRAGEAGRESGPGTLPTPSPRPAADEIAATSGRGNADSRRSIRMLLAAGVLAILVLPGLAGAAAWSSQPATLPIIQQEVLRLGISTPLEGRLGPGFAMRVATPTIVTWTPDLTVNADDLYATRGVRWVVAAVDDWHEVPRWSDAHAEAWDARETVVCYPWSDATYCIYHLP